MNIVIKNDDSYFYFTIIRSYAAFGVAIFNPVAVIILINKSQVTPTAEQFLTAETLMRATPDLLEISLRVNSESLIDLAASFFKLNLYCIMVYPTLGLQKKIADLFAQNEPRNSLCN